MYTCIWTELPHALTTRLALLRPHLLQFLRVVHKLLRIRLGDDPPLIRLLHKVLVALLVRESDSVFLALEVEVGALHEVCAGLPPHERVLPAVALFENIPVHAPVVRVPVAGLCGRLRGLVDAMRAVLADRTCSGKQISYRTVLACSSMGAPETTAAAVLSPGSLPSITLSGTGEKLLSILSAMPPRLSHCCLLTMSCNPSQHSSPGYA